MEGVDGVTESGKLWSTDEKIILINWMYSVELSIR